MAQLLSALNGRRSSFASFNYKSRHNFLVTVQKIGYEQWLAKVVQVGATAPGIQPGGHPTREFSEKKCMFHLRLLANSAMMSTLTAHCQWEDETVRERTGR